MQLRKHIHDFDELEELTKSLSTDLGHVRRSNRQATYKWTEEHDRHERLRQRKKRYKGEEWSEEGGSDGSDDEEDDENLKVGYIDEEFKFDGPGKSKIIVTSARQVLKNMLSFVLP